MKKELKIIGLSYSQTQIGSYIIVLSDTEGNIKLPIIIKPNEAQRIALEIEGISPPRPMIHDLFKTISDFYQIDVQEVYIYSLAEGIFYTRITTSDGLNTVNIECTAGDAIALSVIYKCPIYTTKEILDTVGVSLSEERFQVEDKIQDDIEVDNKRIVSIEDLEKMREEAVKSEEYEIAAEIRDRIEKLKEEEDKKNDS